MLVETRNITYIPKYKIGDIVNTPYHKSAKVIEIVLREDYCWYLLDKCTVPIGEIELSERL